MSTEDKRIALLITEFSGGGVSRMMVNLASGFSEFSEVIVDFIIKDIRHPYLEVLGKKVNLVELKTDSQGELLAFLTLYLSEKSPAVIMSAMLSDHELAFAARERSKSCTRLYFRAGTDYLMRLRSDSIFKRRRNKRYIQNLYPMADAVICVSQGVADSLTEICNFSSSVLHVLRNPTVTPKLLALAEETIDHPWFGINPIPIILGVGNLSRAKNFLLLMHAFAIVRAKRPCRLVIIGKGRQRERLLRCAESLGVDEDVALLGFVSNPYPYMEKANLLVLSSIREGSPNVLVEAMAAGTPVVACNCPSGPKEILENGKYGRLVPMNNASLLATAILESLDNPPSAELLKKAVAPYWQRNSCYRYLKVFGVVQ